MECFVCLAQKGAENSAGGKTILPLHPLALYGDLQFRLREMSRPFIFRYQLLAKISKQLEVSCMSR